MADIIFKSFVLKLAGIYSSSTITNYIAAVKAWHVVHGVAWGAEGLELNAIIKGAKHMAPRTSKRRKRAPITVEYIEKVSAHLSDRVPLDVAVFACLTSAFWSTVRLGELTVRNLSAFNPEAHVKRSDVGEKVDQNGFKMTTIHIPKTKANYMEGEDLYWAKQKGPSDPESALQRHLEINNPDADFHLFGYPDKEGAMIPLTKKTFLKRLSDAAAAARLPRMPGHSI